MLMTDTVKRIETHYIKNNHASYFTLDRLSHLSNNLYNQANFVVRQNFIYNNQYLNYYAIDKLFRKHHYLQDNWNQLPSQAKQQVIKLLDKNWKSFFKSIKDYNKNKSKYLGRPKLPKYRSKGDRFLLILTSQEFKLKDDGYIYLAKKYDRLKIKTQLTNEKINQIRIIPRHHRFKVEVIYEKDNSLTHDLDINKVASIDLGLNNLATLVTNFDTKPHIYNGKKLKSINHYYNYKILLVQKDLNLKQNRIKLNNKIKRAKTALDMKSLYDNDIERFNELIKNNQNKSYKRLRQYTSNRIKSLWSKRENKINDELHKVSRCIINYCLNNNIQSLVIGHNKKQKQKSKLKHFTQLPTFRLIQMLSYKAEEYGIKVIEINEAYTSGTSFLDNEYPIKDHYNKQRRLKRGLFKTNNGKSINSDVNAAYQIMRKYDSNLDIKYSCKLYNPIICDI
jgi:putative transposase